MRKLWVLFVVGAACASGGPEEPIPTTPPADLGPDDETGQEYEPFDETKTDGLARLGGPIAFAAACAPGERLTVAAVGDVLLHGRLQKQAYASELGFHSLWSEVADLLMQSDLTYANLEGPTAAGVAVGGRLVADPGPVFDGVVYTGYPQFNYHPSLETALTEAGIDVVSTANNHALDRRAVGADRTIGELDAVGLAHTGTRARGTGRSWWTATTANGFTLAWVACTFSTNGISDSSDQVLFCYDDVREIEDLVEELARAPGVDAVIVTPHWGVEYTATPRAAEIRLAHRFLDAGALAVIGSHPHVLQPWEKYVTADGREAFVIYSLGNFVSGQRYLPRRSTLLLYLELVRASDGGTHVAGASYVPMHMTDSDGIIRLQAIDRVGGLADSRALTVRMFGAQNIQDPDEPIRTHSACD